METCSQHFCLYCFCFCYALTSPMQKWKQKHEHTHLQRYNHTVHYGCGEGFHSCFDCFVSQTNAGQSRSDLFGCTYGKETKQNMPFENFMLIDYFSFSIDFNEPNLKWNKMQSAERFPSPVTRTTGGMRLIKSNIKSIPKIKCKQQRSRDSATPSALSAVIVDQFIEHGSVMPSHRK